MSEKSPLADGVYFDRPREGAPAFVKGKLAINLEKALPLLKQHVNEKGYVYLDLLEAKETKKLYLTVNTWKPEAKTEVPDPEVFPEGGINPNDIPFK